jgi:ABC-type glycerol-3-phosphate transport system substrate-binding protein
LIEVSIVNIYRKFLEKSRSIFAPSGKMPKIDIILFIAAVAVLAAALIGRGVVKTEKSGRTEVYISAQCEYFFGKELTSALIQEFERQNTDLHIRTATRGGADIVFFDDAGFAALAGASGDAEDGNTPPLAPLSSYILNETGADQRAVPLVYFMDLFFYNIDILTAADCIRPPKTRTEFLTAARSVAGLGKAAGTVAGTAAGDGVHALALGLNREDPTALRREIYPWIWADGGAVAEEGKPWLTSYATDIVAFFGRLNSEGLLAPGTFEKTSAQRLEEFAQGKTAMMAASARDIPYLRANARDVNFGITAIPAVSAFTKNRVGLSGIYAGISGGSELQDEAWAFLAFVAGKRQALYAALGAVPGIYPDVTHGEYMDEDPLLSKAWEIFEAADIVEYYPGLPGEEETGRMVWEKLTEALGQ